MVPLAFPITTDRLSIRFFEDRDRALELAIHSDDSLFTHLPITPRTPAEIDESLEKRVGIHTLDEVGVTVSIAIELAADSTYVGAVQLTPVQVDPVQASIGWIALPSHHRKGLMTEAVRAIVDLTFTSTEVHRLVAEIDSANNASVRLAERLGFRKEAHFVESVHLRGKWRDETVYALLQKDWKP